MAIVLGLNAKLFRGTAGTQGATEMTNVKDVTLSLESGDADVTTRATQGWRASVATLKEGSLEFEMNYDTDRCGLHRDSGGVPRQHPAGVLRERRQWQRDWMPTGRSRRSTSNSRWKKR